MSTAIIPKRDGPPPQTVSKDALGSRLKESWSRIRHLMRKEFLHIIRSKQGRSLLIIAPLMQLIVFGFASRLDVRNVPMVVADLDRSALSRQVIDAFSRSGYFIIKAHVKSYDEVDSYLLKGEASLALVIPPDLELRVKGDKTAEIGILIDGVETTTAGTVAGYAQSILQRLSTEIMTDRQRQMQGLLFTSPRPLLRVPTVSESSRAWFNPNLNSKDFFVPAVIVLIVLAHTVVLTAAVIVREQEIGTIEQLMVAPISRLELILGKTIPCFLIEIGTIGVITPLAFLIFDIPFRGSFIFFFSTFLLFLICACGIGITISAFCKTQQQAVLSSFMFLQPTILLSGYAFPIENMPKIIQYITYLNPLRYFIVIVRGVFLKGTGWEILWPQVLPIFLAGVCSLGLAAFLVKKRAD